VLAFVFGTVVAALLLPMYSHARLSSKWQDVPTAATTSTSQSQHQADDDTAKIVLHLHHSQHHHDESETNPTSITVERISDGHPSNGFIHEDYWYSFQLLTITSSEKNTQQQQQQQQWEIHRIPKTRKLQSESAVKLESINNEESGNTVDGEKEQMSLKKIVTNILLSLSCVILAALAAGLTLGMLSLDPLSLEIKRRASEITEEQQWSEALLPMLVGKSKRHRLLVSLLLLNSLANEALPLFLDELLPGKYAAIIVSVTLVLFFGEIVPSAIFTGPNQVKMAAKLVPMAKAVMFILAPIAVPIAKVLDRVLHDDSHSGGSHGDAEDVEVDVTEGNFYNRTELSALVRIQYESQLADKRRRKHNQQNLLLTKTVGEGGQVGAAVPGRLSGAPALETISSHGSEQNSVSGRDGIPSISHTHHSIRSISRELTAATTQRIPSIHHDEITMIEGALTMTTKRAADVCTPLRRVYALPSDTVLDEDTKVQIWARGFSRVPVYCTEPVPRASSEAASTEMKKFGSVSSSSFEDIYSIVGVLLVRQLIVVDSAENRPISTLPLVLPSCISPSMHLVDLINLFQAAGGRGKGGLHLAIVCARPHLATAALERGESIPKEAGVVGIITLEDVVEELLQEEIYDEADRDLELSRWGVKKWKAFVKTKRLKKTQEHKNGVMSCATLTATTETTPLLK